uniref:Putative secreted protein n=1 Tax=Anopheles darlingi TaxID=43151 RepID=A0A2M4DEP7_ANODA
MVWWARFIVAVHIGPCIGVTIDAENRSSACRTGLTGLSTGHWTQLPWSYPPVERTRIIVTIAHNPFVPLAVGMANA